MRGLSNKYPVDCIRDASPNAYQVRLGERGAELLKSLNSSHHIKANQQKSAVGRPRARKFLGFSFTSAGIPKRWIAPKAVDRFKGRIRELTSRT
jgi:RNA-directed DNA polymerase